MGVSQTRSSSKLRGARVGSRVNRGESQFVLPVKVTWLQGSNPDNSENPDCGEAGLR